MRIKIVILLVAVTLGFAASPAIYRTLPNGVLLNDLKITPGAVGKLTAKQLCDPKFHTSSERADTSTWKFADGKSGSEGAIKAKVYANYGITKDKGICAPEKDKDGKQHPGCEIDHLISLEIGGEDNEANLWPQPYHRWHGVPGAGAKDIVENALHKQVCAGVITLANAQKQISTNWYEVYQRVNK